LFPRGGEWLTRKLDTDSFFRRAVEIEKKRQAEQ